MADNYNIERSSSFSSKSSDGLSTQQSSYRLMPTSSETGERALNRSQRSSFADITSYSAPFSNQFTARFSRQPMQSFQSSSTAAESTGGDRAYQFSSGFQWSSSSQEPLINLYGDNRIERSTSRSFTRN
jgi:hypothetical protein